MLIEKNDAIEPEEVDWIRKM